MSKELEKSIKHVFDRANEMGLMYEYETPNVTKKLNEDIEIVKKLLKRFEPRKPMKDVFKNNRCPRCSHLVDNHYCGECGQKLDWSDENV